MRLLKAPPGDLIEDDAYYTFSSVFFYTNRPALLLNGRKTNLEYGSYAPGAPDVFIDDSDLARLWREPKRYYLLIEGPVAPAHSKPDCRATSSTSWLKAAANFY